MHNIQFPEPVTLQQFLNEFWQKHPLLFENALPDFNNPISPEMLAGLACEPDIESRMVIGNDQQGWHSDKQPITEDTFTQLGEQDWTFLVQDVDKWMPEVAALLSSFRFLPDWRIDDIMISYAAPGGSVGPHIDQYDVFLLQVSGERDWQLQTHGIDLTEELRSDSTLRVMKNFTADKSWTLKPGDMLYLPPGIPHYGVASSEHCMTWSVGLRTPTDHEILSAYTDHLLQHHKAKTSYRDGSLIGHHPAKISLDALEGLDAQLQALLDKPKAEKHKFLARWLSEPKPGFVIDAEQDVLSAEQLFIEFERSSILYRHPFSRLYFTEADGQMQLFCNGKEYPVKQSQHSFVTSISKPRTLHFGFVDEWIREPDNLQLLTELVNNGIFQFSAPQSLFDDEE